MKILYWLIFNAFDQKFDIVYGITNEILRNTINNHIELNKLILDNFLYNRNKDNNLPLYYSNVKSLPNPFMIKYCFYRQRLDILVYLLSITIKRYSLCIPKVKSVVFSVGVEDFCKDWIFYILTSISNLNENNKNL